MSSTTPTSLKQNQSPLASLPSVDRLLNSDDAARLIGQFGRSEVKRVIQDVFVGVRNSIRTGAASELGPAALMAMVGERLTADAGPPLVPVFNLTGTVLHTNLGRAWLPDEAIAAVSAVAGGASNLEFDLEAGQRGDRDSHLETQICRITGAEAATVVNNNAAAVILVLNTLALGREVPVSRGELVEIGGSFRIPDIMARAGCKLVEVGTTNRTHLQDFQKAIGPDTALVMKVHTSNYVIEGFTASVPEAKLAGLCKDRGIPFINDLGSGTLADLERYGLPHEPTPMDALKDGADVVTFSGDKLLGGPQAGLIVGRKPLIAAMKANPLKRALRCDKMTIAALSAVLRLYSDPDRLAERLPVLRALTRPVEEIRALAERVAPIIASRMAGVADVEVCNCESEIGSGALPTRTIASAGIAIRPKSGARGGSFIEDLARAFRALPKPVIGRISNGALVFDLRCLRDEHRLIEQLAEVKLPS